MAQRLGAQIQFPTPMLGISQLHVTPAPGDQTSSSDFHQYMHAHTETYIHVSETNQVSF